MTICVSFWNRTLSHEVNDDNMKEFETQDDEIEADKDDEKKSGASPLSRYVATLREVAQQRNASLPEYSSVLVGEHSSVFGSKGRESDEDGTRDEEGTAVFSSSWLPGKDSKAEPPKDVRRNGRERLSARTKLPWMKILFRSWYSVLMEKTGL
ncbi:hypothetical protein PS2_028553 [Malus domestica]